jgi:very-short-patch-repair endonuclease
MGERLRHTTDWFIERAREIHGDRYDYSLVNYRGCSSRVTIICPTHGPFRMTPTKHLAGRGCRTCAFERIGRERRMTFWEFVDRVAQVHGRRRYEYELQDFVNAHSKIPIRCPEHGVFRQSVAAHLKGHGCPSCAQSGGEQRVREALHALGVEFDEQVRFAECRDRRGLPFDFFVPSHRLLIEFDGRQHYDNSELWGGAEKLTETQRHDRIKDQFAAEHGYRLVRIPYWDTENIEDIILETLTSSEQIGLVA